MSLWFLGFLRIWQQVAATAASGDPAARATQGSNTEYRRGEERSEFLPPFSRQH